MTAMFLNPALSQLLQIQAQAKLRRVCSGFRNPRKFVLSFVSLLLAIVWFGNALASILYRDPYPVETIRTWVSVSLMVYALWHVLKVAWKRPEEAIEWSPAEREIVCGGPFSRKELLTYRLTQVMRATLFKAVLTSLLLFSDLLVWAAGFLGLVLALGLLELWRMVLEIATYSLSRRAYLMFRVAVFGVAGAIVLFASVTGVAVPEVIGGSSTASTTQIFGRFFQAANELRHTSLGMICEAPFAIFAQVITAPQLFHVTFLRWLLPASAIVACMAWLVFWIDKISIKALYRREQTSYDPFNVSNENDQNGLHRMRSPLPHVVRLGGMGPFVWRQMIGAFRHKFGLFSALLFPAIITLLPLRKQLGPDSTFLQVVAGLVAFSFLLLPAALKFDFRRDYDRLYAFKMLPVSALFTVIGQIATPVLLTSLFQLVVLTITVFVCPVPMEYYFSALGMLLPMNVLIFSAENLFFLLSPYRLNQEGIDVFLRTVLVFTAKGLFLMLALAVLYFWSLMARNASQAISNQLGFHTDHRILFIFGVWLLLGGSAIVCTKLLARTYHRYDPSLDAAD